MSSRPKPDIDSWAVATSPDHDDDTVRTRSAKDAIADDDDDESQPERGGEIDWTSLGDVLKRGRTKVRIQELNKVASLAIKGGLFTLASIRFTSERLS